MTLAFTPPEGAVLGYHVVREGWYAAALSPRDRDMLSIGLYGETGGVAGWEFAITEGEAGAGSLRVCVFDDAWGAYRDIPEFFAGLADLGPADVTDVIGLLDRLGFRDLTRRENPYATS